MTAPNFIGGLEQEVYRMQDENFGKLGDPNTYYNQQIRQNQAFLGNIQNIGALQANQIQQLQALRTMQEIQRSAEEERINKILYPVNDGRGGSFFANLRQIEGLKTAQAYNQQLLAQENLQNQTQLNSLKTAEAVDKYTAERQITPKLMDFKARVADLTARIRSGGEDGSLAFKELETLRIDPTLYQYADQTGSLYSSAEGSAGFEAVLDAARKDARSTATYQMKEKVLGEFYEAQDRMDKVLSMPGQLKAGEYEQAWDLRNRIRKAAMSMDMNKPDPEAVGALVLEAQKFNLEGMQKIKDVVDTREAVTAGGLPVSKVTSGPKGAEAEAENPRVAASGDTLAGKVLLKDKEEADKLMANIVQTRANIAKLEGKDKDEVIKDKDGNEYTKEDLERMLAEQEKAYKERVDKNPALGQERDATYQSVSAATAPQGVPNVLTSASTQSAFKPLASAPVGQVNQPTVNMPGKTNAVPVLKLKITRQADGSLSGSFTSPPSTSTNNAAKPK